MMIDPTVLSNIILITTSLTAAFIVALWLSMIVWTYRDIKKRTRDPLIHILAAAVVVVLFIPGIIIYLILRPDQTLEDDYQRTLEEEALLRSIEAASFCPECNRQTQDNWIYCPYCQVKIKNSCKSCGAPIYNTWRACPECGTPNKADVLPGDEIEYPVEETIT